MDRERPAADADAAVERGRRPRAALMYGVRELLEPHSDRFPVGYACDWVAHLQKLDSGRFDAYERARLHQLPNDMADGAEIEQRVVYNAFRSFGITQQQMTELADAARADAQTQGDPLQHRIAAFERLLNAEREAGAELVSFGAVLGQAQKAVEAVVDFALERGLVSGDVQRDFSFQLYGPIEALILASAESAISVPEAVSSVGCFNPDSRMIRVLIDANTLEEGTLTADAIQTAVHETVHAISPVRVIRKVDDQGGFRARKTRVGFYSSTIASHQRRPRALLALNEGVTETMARRIYEHGRLGPSGTGGAYESYVQDVATLRELADLSEDELSTLYLSKDGVLRLGRILRERTALGPHGLALFDIFSREGAGGFTRFLDTMRRHDAGLPYTPIELDRAHLVTQYVGGGDRLKYPPLSPELIGQSFPFVHIREEEWLAVS